MIVTVTVTAEHIAAGERYNYDTCPVALALGSAFPDRSICVKRKTCYVGDVTYDLPKFVTQAIDAFDKNFGMQPMTFTLEDK